MLIGQDRWLARAHALGKVEIAIGIVGGEPIWIGGYLEGNSAGKQKPDGEQEPNGAADSFGANFVFLLRHQNRDRMKRSAINQAIAAAKLDFEAHHWALPPEPRWDVTDFGLGRFEANGLVLVNLAEEAEYCEKLMWARQGMTTPAHTHKAKKEDIICRVGVLAVVLWPDDSLTEYATMSLKVSGQMQTYTAGSRLILKAGERVTIEPGVYHEFAPASKTCIIGEVSTANDDANDNFFINKEIGRYATIEEDEPASLKLVSDK